MRTEGNRPSLLAWTLSPPCHQIAHLAIWWPHSLPLALLVPLPVPGCQTLSSYVGLWNPVQNIKLRCKTRPLYQLLSGLINRLLYQCSYLLKDFLYLSQGNHTQCKDYGVHVQTVNYTAWRKNTNKMQQHKCFIVNSRCWLLTTVSTCFGHLYAHHQEKRPRVTAYGF